jgi:hypothetical protein
MNPGDHKLPLSPGQRILRYAGGIILSACAVMLVLGVTVLADRLHGPQFVLYWTWCFLLSVAAIGVALWDMLLVRRASKQTRRELFRKQFMTSEFSDELRSKTDRHGDDK